MTFLSTKSVLKNAVAAFLAYRWISTDHQVWTSLTKGERNLPAKTKRLLKRAGRRQPVLAEARAVSREVRLRKYRLWSPVPTLATHMVSEFLAPGFDWSMEFEKQHQA